MARSWTKTESARFFLHKYQRATVSDAIEAAAQKARELIPEWRNGSCRIPVDVETIAQRMGIKIGVLLEPSDRRIGALFSEGNKHIAKVAPNGTVGRYRFTLAHEIGHSLFREGSKHRISSLAKMEKVAEDRISSLFAAALLMPAQIMSRVIEQIPCDGCWEIITFLERAAHNFIVSLPAMVFRVGQIHCRRPPSTILLCLEYFVNRYTGTLPELRVLTCSQLGNLSNIRTWYNRSAKGLGLKSAFLLFTKWDEDKVQESGRYTLDTNGNIVRAKKTTLSWTREQLNMSIYTRGSWKKQTMPLRVANCLYAREGWRTDQAYVISIIKGL